MHGNVDGAGQHLIFEFLGEQTLALLTEAGQRKPQFSISPGRDYLEFYFKTGMELLQPRSGPVRLPSGELAATRTDYDFLSQSSCSLQLQLSTCNLQPVTFNLQPATCNHIQALSTFTILRNSSRI